MRPFSDEAASFGGALRMEASQRDVAASVTPPHAPSCPGASSTESAPDHSEAGMQTPLLDAPTDEPKVASLPDTAAPAGSPAEAAAAEMMAKLAAYIESEVNVSTEDYNLLAAMNRAAAARYSGMAEHSTSMVAFAERLQSKCKDMLPQLEQIDVLEAQVSQLEGAVEQLDNYSRRLEAKFSSALQEL